MSTETELFCHINFVGSSYSSLWQVEEEIKNLEKYYALCKQELRDLVMITEPDKYFTASNENGSVYEQVTERIEQITESMDEWVCKLHDLYYLRDNWDNCHDKASGLAIPPPDGIGYETAYYHGDYVRTINDKVED